MKNLGKPSMYPNPTSQMQEKDYPMLHMGHDINDASVGDMVDLKFKAKVKSIHEDHGVQYELQEGESKKADNAKEEAKEK